MQTTFALEAHFQLALTKAVAVNFEINNILVKEISPHD